MSERHECMELKRSLGRKIVCLRKGAGWSQSILAEKLEVSDNFIGQIERGERSPSMSTLHKLSRVFNVPVSELFVFKDSSSNKRFDGRDRQIEKLVLFLRTKDEQDILFINNLVKNLYRQFKFPS